MKSIIATVALLSSVANALTFNTPTNLRSASTANITWTTAAGDPTDWSLFLANTVFNSNFAIANPVNNSAGTLTFTLPAVPPGDGYTLEAIELGNQGQIFSTSAPFAIAAPLNATSSAPATSSPSSSGAAGASGSSAAATSLPTESSAAVSGSASESGGSTTSAPSQSASGSTTGSGSATSASATNFNGAATKSSSMASWAAAVFAMAAGAIAL